MSTTGEPMGQRPVCYLCAVRMSSLFRLPPPPPKASVLDSVPVTANSTEPFVLRDFNASVAVVYETEASVARLAASAGVWDRLASVLGQADAAAGITTDLLLNDKSCEVGSQHGGLVGTVCVACLGLYQFMDDWIVPLVAASVRASPFLDSTTVSTNINCPRSMTFVWLAAAVVFRQGAVKGGLIGSDESLLQPAPSDLIPEEFGSFKDFFQADIRARILSYLTESYTHQVQEAGAPPVKEPGLATITRPAWNVHRRALDVILKKRADEADADNGNEPDLKRVRCEVPRSSFSVPSSLNQDRPFSGSRVPRLCSQALTFAPGGEGIEVDVEVIPPESMEYLAVPDKVLDQLNKSRRGLHGNRKPEPITSIVPTQYCTNKTGTVMQWRVVYDHVFPFFNREKIGCFAETEVVLDMVALMAAVTVRVSHANLFLIGNYRKMVRSISQSPWFCEGGRVGSYSLQEIIGEPVLHAAFPYGVPTSVLPSSVAKRQNRTAEYRANLSDEQNQIIDGNRAAAVEQRICRGRLTGGQASPWQSTDPFAIALDNVFGYGRYKFHSAGREDVDVRMLGTGRPFVLEIISPHRQYFTENDFRALEALVNDIEGGAAEIESLRKTSAEITLDLARHSESKTKTYRCVVWCSRAIATDQDERLKETNATKDLTVIQKTPLRVLHRRSLLDRPKMIHSIRCERINDHWLMVDLETQAGTYVKEFVHGDNGRTVPNLGMLLGGRTDIIQLDVLGMVMPELA